MQCQRQCENMPKNLMRNIKLVVGSYNNVIIFERKQCKIYKLAQTF
jgi:hypothetical protein